MPDLAGHGLAVPSRAWSLRRFRQIDFDNLPCGYHEPTKRTLAAWPEVAEPDPFPTVVNDLPEQFRAENARVEFDRKRERPIIEHRAMRKDATASRRYSHGAR